MEVFVLQIVTLKKNTLIRHFIFLLILAIGFGTVVISQNTHTETAEEKLYYVDAQMLRLITVKTQIPQMSTQKMAQRVADELVEGYDDNPKIRRIIPNVKHGIKVKVLDRIAYVDIKQELADKHPEGRDLELLTVYSIVNSLTGLDGIVNVRFTIDGKRQKDFKGYIDMRETFIPDYFI